jgi:hypothetical protein
MKNATTKALGLAALIIITLTVVGGQQPQTSTAPIYAANAKYTNGVAPGYWPTKGSGLTLNLSAGTSFCSGSIVTYSAGTLTMTASTTNNVYLNTASSCVPATKTSAFTSADIPIAQVITGTSTITSITDIRTPFIGGGGAGSTIPYVATTGSVNAMVATFSPAIASYTTGMMIAITANNATTGTTPTINVNGLGVKNIGKSGTSGTLGAGDIVTTTVALLVYNGSFFDLQNPQAQVGPSGLGSASAPAFAPGLAPSYGLWVSAGNVRLSANATDILDCNVGSCAVNGDLTPQTLHVGNGFTGTKTAGSCVMTIVAGVITNVTGC